MIEINRAQAMALWTVANNELWTGENLVLLDQAPDGAILARAGEINYRFPVQGGHEKTMPETQASRFSCPVGCKLIVNGGPCEHGWTVAVVSTDHDVPEEES
jgi:hypothetical protein